MINKKKIINDFYGKGKHDVVPYSKKFTSGKEVNIAKYSGLVSVIKRRSSSEIADDWSKNIFGNSFSETKYTAKIPAVIARHTYVLETILSKLNLLNKEVCDFGAGEGDFLTMLKKKINCKGFGIEPSKKNCALLTKNKIKNFNGTIEEFYLLNKKKKFDVGTIMWTLCNTSNCFEIVSNASNLIKKNGYIVVAESSRILVPFKKPLQMYFGKNNPDLHPFHFTKNSLSNLLVLNKFRPVFINRYIDSDYLLIIAKKIDRIEEKNLKLDKAKDIKEFFKRWFKESQNYKKEVVK
ncbi:methyltransferase domain-containing protein [Candidatus Pelagibacter bacterium nBUS_25]|uniref:methyltransferase domain-containing protein n=1 Tax=Candidatus Pelagibacter bacterium nBUS_25 TaxID=3374187 RepID=UPI003EC06BF4